MTAAKRSLRLLRAKAFGGEMERRRRARYAGRTHIGDVILRGPIDIIQAIEFDLVERIPPDPQSRSPRA